jgi:hypothetical protein
MRPRTDALDRFARVAGIGDLLDDVELLELGDHLSDRLAGHAGLAGERGCSGAFACIEPTEHAEMAEPERVNAPVSLPAAHAAAR